ncbi:MAG: Rieske 2Fe-2S domain-containing protein [Bacteroidota bacterium]
MPLTGLYNWHKIAGSEEELAFAPNQIAVASIHDKKICIGRHNNHLYAFAYGCPHAGGILADGYMDALGNIVCPVHAYKFSLQNGRNSSGEGYYLRHWPVERRVDGIYVGLF